MLIDRTTGEVSHHRMDEIASLLPQKSLLVFNDSRVRKARLVAESETGGSVDVLLIDRLAASRWRAVVTRAKRQRIGRTYAFPGDLTGSIVGVDEPYRIVEFSRDIEETYLETYGHVPLPPYIRRPDTKSDADRYQTVYAQTTGSAAAPTAGLHFTRKLIAGIESHGVETAWVTLHVGLGTFLPIRTASIEEHTMHEERYEVSEVASERVNATIGDGRPVVAVGTTTVRTLEAAGITGLIAPGTGSTDLYIRPGYRFRVASGLFTNFHTPESSLLVMVSAFAGVASIRAAYQTAISEEYRFFSYGDAMLIL